jgi:hypothetical protein
MVVNIMLAGFRVVGQPACSNAPHSFGAQSNTADAVVGLDFQGNNLRSCFLSSVLFARNRIYIID